MTKKKKSVSQPRVWAWSFTVLFALVSLLFVATVSNPQLSQSAGWTERPWSCRASGLNLSCCDTGRYREIHSCNNSTANSPTLITHSRLSARYFHRLWIIIQMNATCFSFYFASYANLHFCPALLLPSFISTWGYSSFDQVFCIYYFFASPWASILRDFN